MQGNDMRTRAWRTALMALVLMTVGGCASSARVVTAITSSRDQIKFLYVEGTDQGVIKCKVASDGAIGQCRQMAVAYED